MNHIFWAIKDRLAGRAGPDLVDWQASELYRAGIRSILTVNDGYQVEAEELLRSGIVYQHYAFPTGAPPYPDAFDIGMEVLPKSYNWYLKAPKPLLVHCSAGKDRTGLFIAYTLMIEQKLTVIEAMKRTREIRPIAFTAYGWEEFVHDMLIMLNKT